MINVTIYLAKEKDAVELTGFLLEKNLIASASIDKNNVSFEQTKTGILKKIYSVITAQSKALLFNDIVKAVESKLKSSVPIYSTPIVGSNKIFDDLVKTNTIKI